MSTIPNSRVQLLESGQYITDLVLSITRAKKHVYIMSLIFTDDDATHALITALLDARKRGVAIFIAADTFTYSELGGYFSPFKKRSSASQIATRTVSRLIEAGVQFKWVGSFHRVNPFSGVTHTKWSVVDDTCYVFGGVNLYNHGIHSVDYMFHVSDPELTQILIAQHTAIIESTTSHPYQEFSQKIALGHMYIDSGERHTSIIYDRACDLARQSKEILYVSQYCPSGPLASALYHTKTSLYFNRPDNATFPTSLLLAWERYRSGLPSLYTKKQYLHAKFIVFTLQDSSKVAITGSHNFSHTGVKFGTREIALETRDPDIIAQLESFRALYVV